MSNINIGYSIVQLRKKYHVSQEELASFLGLSKAAISKWETGKSYPDITLLPKISSFFNITIDQLLDYQPQLNKAEIKDIYEQLSSRFSTEPFTSVFTYTEQLVKKYYACHDLLLQIGVLYLNYANMAPNPSDIITKANALFKRVLTYTNDIELIKLAQNLNVTALLLLNKPHDIINELGDNIPLLIHNEVILAQAQQLLGNYQQATLVIQASSYQLLLQLLEQLTAYIALPTVTLDIVTTGYQRILGLAQLFKLRQLHPTFLLKAHLAAAASYCHHHQFDLALTALTNYVNLATTDIFPFQLHGDDFFNMLDDWINNMQYPLPRVEKVVRQSIYDAIVNNPIFNPLKTEPQFIKLEKQLKQLMIGEQQ